MCSNLLALIAVYITSLSTLAVNIFFTWRGKQFYDRANCLRRAALADAFAIEKEREVLRHAFDWLGNSIPPEMRPYDT